jgi:tetratricopeptide (TPR) repeat protein
MQLAGAIGEFWEQRGHHKEALRRYRSLLQADQLPSAARAKALTGAAAVAPACGEIAQAQRWAEEALALYRRFGDEFGEANSLWQLGYIRVEEGDPSTAEGMIKQALELFRRVGDETSLRWASRTLAFAYLRMGDSQRARPLYEENLRRARDSGDRELQAASLGGLTDIALQEDRLTDAIAFQQESLRLVIHLNDELMAISRLCVAADALAKVGRTETAARLIGYAASRYEETGAVEAWVLKMNDKTLVSIAEHIGKDRLTSLQAEGATLTPENALHLAVAETNAASEDLSLTVSPRSTE